MKDFYTFTAEAQSSNNNQSYYQKCKDEARDLLYESIEDRVSVILNAWPAHFGFMEIAVDDFNKDYKAKGFSIDHDPLYKRSLEFNNVDIGSFSLHKVPDSSEYDLRFSPEASGINPIWSKFPNKEKAYFVAKAVVKFLMSEENDRKHLPALINDYPDFVNYVFGIYGRS